jgi:hypothetical protein
MVASMLWGLVGGLFIVSVGLPPKLWAVLLVGVIGGMVCAFAIKRWP